MKKANLLIVAVILAGGIFLPWQTCGQEKPEHTRHPEIKQIGGIKFIKLPGGSFMMGSPENAQRDDEKPRHRVTLDPFYMGIYEVTQKQYHDVTGENPSRLKGDNLPVENVSWQDAMEFCRKFGEKNKVKARLPYEAEWEYAVRAGSTSIYYWGDRFNGDYCWYDKNSGNRPHPVGTKLPNAWGLYDMSGNVWEWCMDWYAADYYKSSPELNPQGAVIQGADYLSFRVLRGGSWAFDADAARSARRIKNPSRFHLSFCGFRIVLPIQRPEESKGEKQHVLIGRWSGEWSVLQGDACILIIHDIDASGAKARCTYTVNRKDTGIEEHQVLAALVSDPDPKLEFNLADRKFQFIFKNDVLEGSARSMTRGYRTANHITMRRNPK